MSMFPYLFHCFYIFLSERCSLYSVIELWSYLYIKCCGQDHLRRILRGQASLFDWSRSTSLARTLSPRVLESQIDAKKVNILLMNLLCSICAYYSGCIFCWKYSGSPLYVSVLVVKEHTVCCRWFNAWISERIQLTCVLVNNQCCPEATLDYTIPAYHCVLYHALLLHYNLQMLETLVSLFTILILLPVVFRELVSQTWEYFWCLFPCYQSALGFDYQ